MPCRCSIRRSPIPTAPSPPTSPPDARPRRPRPGHRPVRGGHARRCRRRAGPAEGALRRRRRPGRRAGGPRRLHPHRHPPEARRLAAEDDRALTEEERVRGKEFAGKISLRVLARAWQMLLKGIDEAKEASRPLAAADMVIVRLAHAADLPTPDEALKALAENGGVARRASREPRPAGTARVPRMAAPPAVGASAANPSREPAESPAPQARARPPPRLETFADLVALAGAKRELRLKHALENEVRPIRFEPGQIEIALTAEASSGLAGEMSRRLEQWTGQRWMVAVAREGGGETVAEARRNARARLVDDARADPVVAAVMDTLPRRRDRRCARPRRRSRRPLDDVPPPRRRLRARTTRTMALGDMMGMMQQAKALQEKMEQLQQRSPPSRSRASPAAGWSRSS